MGRKLSLGIFLAGLLVLAAASPALGQSVVWIGVNANLVDTANYNTSTLGTDITFGGGATVTTGLSGDIGSLSSVTFTGSSRPAYSFSSGSFTLSGDILVTGPDSGNAITFGSAYTLTLSASAHTIGVGASNFQILGNIGESSAGATLTKTGTGTLTLSGTNTYTGGTNINAGTLQFAGLGSLAGGIEYSNLFVASGATAAFNVGGTGEFASSDIDNLFANMAGFQGGSFVGLDTTHAAGGNFVYNGTITDTSNGALGLVKLGSGSLTLGSDASTFSGGVTVSGYGTLLLGASSTIVDNMITQGPIGTGTLTLNHAAYLGVSSGPITLDNPIYLDNGGYGFAGIDTSNGDLTLTGNITERLPSQLQISGGNTLTLSGISTYTLNTILEGGTLLVGSSSSGAPGDVLSGPIGTGYLDMSDNTTLGVAASGGPITLSNDIILDTMYSPVTFDTSNGDLTLNGYISGYGPGLIKTGGGTLTLNNGSNDFQGGLTVNAGTLLLGASSSFDGSNVTSGPVGTGTLTMENGTTLGVASGADPVTLHNAIVFDYGLVTVDTTNGNLTLLGVIIDGSDSSGLLVQGGNSLSLFGQNTYSGGTEVAGGATLLLGISSYTPPSQPIAYSPVGVNDLTLDSGATLGVAAAAEGPITLDNNIWLGGGNATIDTTNGDLIFTGVIHETSPASLTVHGTHSLTLNWSGSDYSGGTSVTGGTLLLGSSSNYTTSFDSYGQPYATAFVSGPIGTGDLKLYDGTTLGVASGAGTVYLANTIALDCRSETNVTVDTTGGNLILMGVISGDAGLTLTGGNALALAADNTFSGGITVTNGSTLQLGTSTKDNYGNLTSDPTQMVSGPIGTGTLTLNDGAILSTAGYNDVILANNITLSGGDGVTFGLSNEHTSDNITFYYDGLTLGGALTGSAPINLYGDGNLHDGNHNGGNLTFDGDNSGWSGGLNIYGNNYVTVNTDTGLGTGPLWFSSDSSATVEFASGNPTINGLSGGFSGSYNSTVLVDGSTTLTINQNSSATFAGVIAGYGNITVAGGYTLTLTGTNIYWGTMTVSNSALSVSRDANLGDPSSYLVLDGGTLEATSSFTLNANRNIFVGSSSSFAVDPGVTLTYNGIIADLSGPGHTGKSGTGTLVLGGANTFSGGFTMDDGTLSISSDANLGDPSGGIIFHGGTLETTASFTLASTRGIQLAPGVAVTFSPDLGTTLTYGGVIDDGGNLGSLIKTGFGNLTLSGANTYGGGTVVNSGELDVSGGSIGTSSSDITVGSGSGDNATLGVLNAGTVTSGTGNIAVLAGSTGAVTVSGSGSSWTNTNYLYVGEAGTGSLTISNGGAVSSPNTSIGNNSGGIGTLTVTGSGSTLTDNAGTLYVGAAGSGTLIIQNGGVVTNGSGSIGNNAGGTGSATVDGAGSSWTTNGNLIVGDASSGTLTVTNGGQVSSTSANLGGFGGVTGTASVSGAGSTWSTLSVNIGYAGNGSLLVASGGTLTLNSGLGTAELGSQSGSTGTLNIGAASTDVATAGGFVDAASITTGSGSGILQFNTTASSASPYYLTKDGTSGGTGVTISGPTQVVNTAGYNVLTGANTYTGGTTINGGTLVAGNNSALGTGAVTLSGGQLGVSSGVTVGNSLSFTSGVATLSGNGTIGSHVTVDSHVIVSPGNSPGNLTFSAGLTLSNLGEYDWQLQSVAGAPLTGAGTNWDLITISTGTLDLPTTGSFTLKVISLNAGGTAGNVSDFNSNSTYTWTIATAAGGITGNVNNITIDTSLFSNLPGTTGYSLSISGNDLNLIFTPVPEPSTYALLALGLGCIGLGVRRKIRRR